MGLMLDQLSNNMKNKQISSAYVFLHNLNEFIKMLSFGIG